MDKFKMFSKLERRDNAGKKGRREEGKKILDNNIDSCLCVWSSPCAEKEGKRG